jgi:Ca2+-transporting ATPase
MNGETVGVMQKPPKNKKEAIITPVMWISIVVYAICITLATLGSLIFAIYYLHVDAALANNFAFYTLILAQLWHVFNLPETGTFFRNAVTENIYIWLSIITCILITVLAYMVPLFREILHLESFSWAYSSYVIGFSLLPLLAVQLLKRLNFIQ